jgi:SSS family solute:Na+ symporter
VGWLVGIVAGTAMAASMNFTPTYALSFAGYTLPVYTALSTVVLNLVVAIVLTPVFNALLARGGKPIDVTVPADYYA